MDIKKYIKNKVALFQKPLYKIIAEQKAMINSQKEVIWNLERNLTISADEKIIILFICSRPAVWGSLESVYDKCVTSSKIKPYIIAIPNKKDLPNLELNHEEYIDEGAYDYFINKGYSDVLNGYNQDTDEWINIKKFSPHYVFIQTPYDICRPLDLKSLILSSYTKVCFIHYAVPFMDGVINDSSSPVDFLTNIDLLFAETEEKYYYYKERLKNSNGYNATNVVLSGAPKFDISYKHYDDTTSEWKYKGKEKKIRVMWTPRWCLDEDNCTFFEYKDKIIEFMSKHPEFELIFRPHPQAFIEYEKTGVMTKDEIHNYLSKIEKIENTQLDSFHEYLNNFYTSDILITDESSIISEYFLTGKPIIFTYKKTHFTSFAKKLSEGFYWAKNWDEIEETILKLSNGIDELNKKRKDIIKNVFYLPDSGAGNYIVDYILNDFFEGNRYGK